MKTLIKIIALGVLTVLLTMAARANDVSPKRLKPTNDKDKNLFVVRADKKLLGARVQIFQSNGNKIAEQVLTRRRLLIDFRDIESGAYTIRLVKGETTKEFSYHVK